MRINKFLAENGIASRRHADEMVAAGRVKINGETVKLEGEIYFYNIANRNEEGYEGCNMEIEYTYDIDIPEWKDVKETFKRTEQIW